MLLFLQEFTKFDDESLSTNKLIALLSGSLNKKNRVLKSQSFIKVN
jgi:hypothetical protein